ncbi:MULTISPECIES: DMT family transporter [Gammaproteobacteria]|uniref:EamA domain-containing protein n=1 Tax=Photobacterium carnosum TaxID=2023717 RepID=A0A2N4UWP1_9GAMM|nr:MULTISPECIES: DMT family transporter [Gammaproteobacteria]MCD9475796.1 EamA family transporter [Photobacterium phosphoreum]MCD9485984.1 EamA family transporter [Photobacterium iliopiscarium]MCD9507657.1 EamA family transporter [Photobacterium phosphoreum]MCD9539368.1 EamA family transporter [Photobacterium carnosum]MCD9543114.1 EamA family transporter [Photobacterium carnosum]
MTKFTERNSSPCRSVWLVPLMCLLVGGALLGISTNVAKYAGEIGLSPLAFLFWSIAGAATILLVIALLRHELPPLNKRSFEYYFISALVSVAGSNLLFFSAIPHVGAGFVALIISLPPLLTYLGALALGMERFQTVRALGVAAALAGAGVLAARKFSAPDASVFWILIALCGPVLLAIGNLYRTLRWPEGASPNALAPGMLIAAVVLLGATSLLPDFSLTVPLGGFLPLGLITLQAFIFAGQFQLLFLLQKTGGPVLLSLLGSVGAIVGVPVAVFLQGESPPDGLILGASLIALGVALVTWGGMKMMTLSKQKLEVPDKT